MPGKPFLSMIAAEGAAVVPTARQARRPHRAAPLLATAALGAGLLVAVVAGPAVARNSAGAGRGPGSPVGAGLRWQVAAHPFRLTFRRDGRTVAAEAPGALAGPGGRLVYQAGSTASSQDGAVFHRVTDLVSSRPVARGTAYAVGTDEPGRTATVTVRRTAEGARVQWSLSTPAGSPPVTVVADALSAGADEHYLGASSAAYVDLRGHIRGWSPGKEGHEAGAYCQNQEQSAAPFYLSSAGYGIRVDTTSVGRFAFPGAAPVADDPSCDTPSVPTGDPVPYPCPVAATPQPDRVQLCLKDDALDYDVYAGSPAEVTSGYYHSVGLPALPPPGQFGVTKWRDVSADQAEVLSDVAQFRQLGIPLNTIFIDNPWEQQPPGNTARVNGSACNRRR
jgi:hypothetical protein